MRARLRRLRRQEGGYSLLELVLVTAILSTILGALTTVFVQGTRAELHANNRVQAQLQATAALDRMRRDVHCSSSGTVTGSTLTLVGCSFGHVSWCAVGSGTRYALYRLLGDTCNNTGKQYADYLTAAAFTYTAPVASTSLAKVHVDWTVNVSPATAFDVYRLTDDIVLRNSSRS